MTIPYMVFEIRVSNLAEHSLDEVANRLKEAVDKTFASNHDMFSEIEVDLVQYAGTEENS